MMAAADLLPWMNLLLLPAVGMLVEIKSRMAAIEVELRNVRARLHKLDGIHA